MMKERLLLFLTRGFARYRQDLVRAVAGGLPEGWHLVHASKDRDRERLWEVDDELYDRNRAGFLTREMPALSIGSFLGRPFRSRPLAERESAVRMETMWPDVIVIQEFSVPMLASALYARRHGVPCAVCTDMGRGTDWSRFRRGARLVHALGSRLVSGVVAHSPEAREPLCEGKPVCYVPHGIAVARFRMPDRSQRAPGPVRLLLVGQYIPRKGHDLLAAALKRLVDHGCDDFELRLVGTQNPDWVRGVIGDAGLEGWTKILGVLKGDELVEEYAKADVFVLPCRFDTFAVVVHEAAAAGLPLVISRHAAASRVLVEEGKNGFVVDPYDTEAMADRLGHLIRDPALRLRMGERSRRIAEDTAAEMAGVRLGRWLMQLAAGHSLHSGAVRQG